MIAVDACVMISFLAGEPIEESDFLATILASDQAILAPSTIAELLSDPKGGPQIAALIDGMKVLPLGDGYWHRAGLLRAAVRRDGRKAALGDALAAQACIDADVALLTYDKDFRAFAKIAGLKLAN
ncbi:MAG TPA: PIN domain-containing protein [Caulobacteraceae bacterium]